MNRVIYANGIIEILSSEGHDGESTVSHFHNAEGCRNDGQV